MTLTNTPVCDFGAAAPDFDLPGVDGKNHSLASVSGPRGTLVMFICNHCPYVIAVQQRLLRAASALTAAGVGVVAINPNAIASGRKVTIVSRFSSIPIRTYRTIYPTIATPPAIIKKT